MGQIVHLLYALVEKWLLFHFLDLLIIGFFKFLVDFVGSSVFRTCKQPNIDRAARAQARGLDVASTTHETVRALAERQLLRNCGDARRPRTDHTMCHPQRFPDRFLLV